eukprot:5129369-Alexandrium_andersonii.AAC.1
MPVYDHRTGERSPPHLVKLGRATEWEQKKQQQLFARVPAAQARGKRVRCQWLGEGRKREN